MGSYRSSWVVGVFTERRVRTLLSSWKKTPHVSAENTTTQSIFDGDSQREKDSETVVAKQYPRNTIRAPLVARDLLQFVKQERGNMQKLKSENSHHRVAGGIVLGGLAAAFVVLLAGSTLLAAPAAEQLYVSSYATNTISVYPRTVSGDVAPIRTIQAGLDHPHQIAVDILHQELFVANNVEASASPLHTPAVVVYDLNASYPINDAPKRVIAGPSTGLTKPTGLYVDMVNQELYVTNDVTGNSSIEVFPLSASGDVAPIRIIQGSLTGLNGPVGVVVDHVHNELFVACYKVASEGSVSAFSRTASGDVAPLRVIQGATTFLRQPQEIALDLNSDEIVVADSLFQSSTYMGAVMFYNRTDTGNVLPSGEIFGAGTGLCNPVGLVLDTVNNEIVVANSHFGPLSCSESVTTYGRSARDNAAPLRTLGAGALSGLASPISVAITTKVLCSDPSVANGTPCDDGDACTQTDTCLGGVCAGTNPTVCTASDQCHMAGACNATTGLCSNPNAIDGTTCTDGNACTSPDTCVAGQCVGGPSTCGCHVNTDCNDNNPCTNDVCNTTTGVCSNQAATNGTACSDGNACTRTDTCQNGTCTGSNPVVCTASDQCHVAGSCNPGTGQCANPMASNGTPCSDGNACTRTDTCQSGTCTGSNPVVCTANDQCHVAGTCEPQTGQCSNPAAPDGTFCGTSGTCLNGACVTGNNPPVCTGAAPSLRYLWPPDGKFDQVSIVGVTDPDGQNVRIAITAIRQDEPLMARGAGNTCPDAKGVGKSKADLRAERSGGGDGRVYHLSFTANDGRGGRCSGEVKVCVPRDAGNRGERLRCGDQGAAFDSTGPCH